jgi:putative endonuclease
VSPSRDPAPVSTRHQKAYRSGLWAETIAMIFLMLKGYWPLARRFGGKGGEIDLIMKRGSTLIFVEVKARRVLDDALSAITPRKQALMTRTLRLWQSRHSPAAHMTLRVDALMLAPWRWPRHIENVFEVG